MTSTTTVALVGAAGGQGTTTTAVALAALAARSGQRTAIIGDRPDDLAAELGIGATIDDDHDRIDVAPNLTLGDVPADTLVTDLGQLRDLDGARHAWHTATFRYLVIRPAYVALRAASHAPLLDDVHGLVVVEEPGTSLGASECADVLGVPIAACIPWHARIGRVVDAGVILARIPAELAHPVSTLAPGLVALDPA